MNSSGNVTEREKLERTGRKGLTDQDRGMTREKKGMQEDKRDENILRLKAEDKCQMTC